MAKDLSISVLLDYYGEMLTQKQREVMEFYYNEDLSLAEIAQHSGITRQGVRDSIKRGEAQLYEFEEKLKFAEKFARIERSLQKISDLAKDIEFINDKYGTYKEIYDKSAQIITLSGTLLSEE